MSLSPTGTLTFLFTDVAGSTRLWDTQHEAMKQAHGRQADLIAESVQAHQGHLVRNRGEGDSTFAVFYSPAAAVAAAAAFQRALQAEIWPTEFPLRVRAALHLGPAELREGDYNSTAVNRCARLRSLASPGQTLVSQAVAEQVRASLPEGVTLLALGSHKLKDLQQPEQVYQLCHPELPEDFAPLRSLDTLPTNLPQQLTRFIGREAEIATLIAMLCADSARGKAASAPLLTLLGTGGAGKTRLAVQVGAELLDAYPDGVWLVELAALAEGMLVPQVTARALGLQEQPGRTSLEALAEYLRNRKLLLLLDNCEHLVSACAQMAQKLLQSCPGLQILATSREPLNIPAETLWRIPSLSLPPEQNISAETLQTSEAVQLFLDRVQSVAPGFEITEQNAGAIERVSRRLDGIPLALELAAARAKFMSVEQIAARLDDRFRLLTGGSRTALPRQQTLRGLMDWSYDLLTEQEKGLLARLAIFLGGWTMEAAEKVCSGAGIEEWEVLDLLSGLVDKSLVLAEEKQGATRYRMLETVRQYSAEKLAESGEEAEIRKRHSDWCLAFVEEVKWKLDGAEQAHWFEVMETEHDNLRQAMTFCLETPGEAETALKIAGGVQRFWWVRGHLFEGRVRYAAVLSHPETQEANKHRGQALHGAGVLAYMQSDNIAAREYFEAFLAIQRQLGNKAHIASGLHSLGNIAYVQGDKLGARALYEESLEIEKDLGRKSGIAAGLNNLGNVANELGDYSSARTLMEESLTLLRELGNRVNLASALQSLGSVMEKQKDYSAAWELYTESLAIRQELGNKMGIAYSLQSLGSVAEQRKDYVHARTLFKQALGIQRELGNRLGIAEALEALANVAWAEGATVKATQLWSVVGRLREEMSLPQSPDDQHRYDRFVEEARQSLGEEAFRFGWSAGRAMSPEQAIALAQEPYSLSA